MSDSGNAIGSASSAPTARISRTISNVMLQRQQHTHALFALLIPLLATLAAIALWIVRGPPPLAIGVIAIAMFVVVGLGTAIGTHRHFTHGAFRAPPAVRVALMILGSMAGQGPVVFWVALHRMHHELADREGDPHSPNLHGSSRTQRLRGIWHAWFGWTVKHPVPNANFYARDLLRDRLMMRINGAYAWWVALGFVIPGALGGMIVGTWLGALEGVLWGGAARMFAGHNAIYVITCAVHVFGSRDFDCRDQSRNNGWFALYTLGESWHNNHHAFPRAAHLRMRWWQIDLSGMMILLMQKVGWASDLCVPSVEEIARRRVRHVELGSAANNDH